MGVGFQVSEFGNQLQYANKLMGEMWGSREGGEGNYICEGGEFLKFEDCGKCYEVEWL